MGAPPLEGLAPIKGDFSVDRKFLKPPAFDLGRVGANEPDRSYIGAGGVPVGDEATHQGPVIRLRVQVRDVEFNVVMA